MTYRVGGVSCIVDTDIVIDFLRGRAYARELLEQWMEKGLLAVSVVTHTEVYRGLRTGEEEATNALLEGLVSIPVTAPLARRAGFILRELGTQAKTVGTADSIVAATALTLEVPLMTNNVKHYPIPGLNVVEGAKT